ALSGRRRAGWPSGAGAADDLRAGEVHDPSSLASQVLDQRPVAHVALDETESPVLDEIREVTRRRRAAERVENSDQDLRIGTEPVPDKGGAEEARPARDQQVPDPRMRH